MEENNYTVYMHVNKINNKKYIGMTGVNPLDRWKNGFGYHTQQRFWRSIEKYGWENFDHYILFINLTSHEASVIEDDLINLFNTRDGKYGYNICSGGGKGNNKIVYQYSLDGKFIASYNNTFLAADAVLGAHQSCIAAACRGSYHHSCGYIWRYEKDVCTTRDLTKDEITHTHRRSIPICEYNLKGELLFVYEKITDAANKYNISTTNISKACKKQIKKCHGSIWRYLGDELTEDEIASINDNNRYRQVSQYDMDWNFIANYKSIAEAMRMTGIKDTSIQQCCIGKYKHAGHFKWKYAT